MEDITNKFTKEEMEEKKLMAILSYLGFLVIIPILQAKDSVYVRHHINQGIVLIGICFVLNLLAFIPVIGMIVGVVAGVVFLAGAGFNILNIVNGKVLKVPVLSNFEIIK